MHGNRTEAKTKVYSLKPGAEDFPLMIPLSLSMVCNARCPICPYVVDPSIPAKYKTVPYMPVDLFKKIADEASCHNSYLRLSGREPTLHPSLVSLVEYAKDVGRNCKVGLITNGSLLTSALGVLLVDNEIDSIEVSVDAADTETYSRVRVGLDFDTMLSNVRQLVRWRDKFHSRTIIIASVINQKETSDKIDSIVSFWSKIVDNVQVRKYLTWGFLDTSKSGNDSPYLDEDTPCPFPFERLNIDPLGDISLCGYDIGFDKAVLGNVYKQSIASVWHGDELKRIRSLMLEKKWDKLPLCKKCTDRKFRSWDYTVWKVYKDARRRK